MSRISIDVSPEEHKRVKAMAALQGKSIKSFLLGDLLEKENTDQERALVELEHLLNERLKHHHSSGLKGGSSASEILKSVMAES